MQNFFSGNSLYLAQAADKDEPGKWVFSGKMLNGADPRLPGGAVSTEAMEYGAAGIPLAGYNRVKARIRADDGAWSALEEAEYFAATSITPFSPLEIADHYVVSEAYPNPTQGIARARLAVSKTQHVRVTLHDMLGREIYRVLDRTIPSETPETLVVDGTSLSSGVYILRIRGEHFSAMRSFIVAQ